MAMQTDPHDISLLEQFERLRRMSAESDKLHEERLKLASEQAKFASEQLKIIRETKVIPAALIMQAMLATAALLGAGAAIAKIFLPG